MQSRADPDFRRARACARLSRREGVSGLSVSPGNGALAESRRLCPRTPISPFRRRRGKRLRPSRARRLAIVRLGCAACSCCSCCSPSASRKGSYGSRGSCNSSGSCSRASPVRRSHGSGVHFRAGLPMPDAISRARASRNHSPGHNGPRLTDARTAPRQFEKFQPRDRIPKDLDLLMSSQASLPREWP